MTQEQIKKVSRVTYFAMLLGVILWLIAIIAPACFFVQKQVLPAYLMRKILSPVCHQIIDRSFLLWGYPLAVCARCSGIYFGVLLGILFYPLLKSYKKLELLPRSYLIVMLLPTTVDFLLGAFHILENTHFSRAFTGVIAGFALAFYIARAIINLALEITKTIASKRKGVVFYGSK
ncbi:MAG: DUF2085 domain-containing protein [Acidobacteria bacterium]|nr:DUF2085 domain-containing protein [Acidobacteriota bacterium]